MIKLEEYDKIQQENALEITIILEKEWTMEVKWVENKLTEKTMEYKMRPMEKMHILFLFIFSF